MKDCFQLLPLQSGIQLFTSQAVKKYNKKLPFPGILYYNRNKALCVEGTGHNLPKRKES